MYYVSNVAATLAIEDVSPGIVKLLISSAITTIPDTLLSSAIISVSPCANSLNLAEPCVTVITSMC